jgi:hypothetical protein
LRKAQAKDSGSLARPGDTKSGWQPTKARSSRRQRDPADVERSRQRQEFGRIKSIVFTVR